jgi:hypothetical protein
MRVRCIKSSAYGITAGNIYHVLKVYNHPGSVSVYTIANNDGISRNWYSSYFEQVPDDLPLGWHYCRCGTITSNLSGICCDCKGKD